MQGEDSFQIPAGTEGDSFPLMEINTGEPHTSFLQTEASEQWDYVLVADHRTQRNTRQAQQQQQFLEELKRKGFHYKGEEDLKKKWAQWRNMVHTQPIDDIRDYFGEKVALYFAWLGWYTYMLVPAAVAGLIIFLSGFSLFNASQISKEICEAHDILLCPRGDHSRRYQQLSDTCTFAKLTHLFDNEGTVLFAIFMALWATVFLEIWKRQRARVVLHWDLYGWDEDQEEMALELINCPEYELRPYQHSYLRSTVILILSLLMICLMIGIAHLLVVYRVLAAAYFNSALLFREEQVTTAVVVTGALVHYVAILIMTKINKFVALKLCDFEKPRTFSERESKFTVKFFTLQFFAHFSSLVYIAFILGRINGHPGNSVRLAGLWKLEECHLSGCMMDLFLQMAIIMGLKQTLSNCAEYLGPWLSHKCRLMRSKLSPASRDPELRDLQRNYLLNPVNTFSLFDEFMEMMIQYGFTTIFVAAFPLAPLLALFSNLVEIRLDAIKMVRLQRRLVPRKAKDIGTWLQVLETIGVLAVIANGMVIAFTSEFIPRVVYKYHYGPCRQGARPAVDCLTGYINHSLSVFYTKDFQDPVQIEGSENVTECRYRDYRSAQDYSLSEQFWVLLAIRLVFLILFEVGRNWGRGPKAGAALAGPPPWPPTPLVPAGSVLTSPTSPLAPCPPARGFVHQAYRCLVRAGRSSVGEEQGSGGEVPGTPGEDALQPQEHRGVGDPEPVQRHRCPEAETQKHSHHLPSLPRACRVPGGRCACREVSVYMGFWRAHVCEVSVSSTLWSEACSVSGLRLGTTLT
ncbi:anoctamin-9 isoform X3 [Ursus americanus]|uniref:anoctamin-9 isoform X3 n=1 Tax=Ursus americanus TaxID=9643 RepID=UPI001E6794EC|nr:anoctamin-9 isoform X3 [Ursus americanus]